MLAVIWHNRIQKFSLQCSWQEVVQLCLGSCCFLQRPSLCLDSSDCGKVLASVRNCLSGSDRNSTQMVHQKREFTGLRHWEGHEGRRPQGSRDPNNIIRAFLLHQVGCLSCDRGEGSRQLFSVHYRILVKKKRELLSPGTVHESPGKDRDWPVMGHIPILCQSLRAGPRAVMIGQALSHDLRMGDSDWSRRERESVGSPKGGMLFLEACGKPVDVHYTSSLCWIWVPVHPAAFSPACALALPSGCSLYRANPS